MGQQQHQQQHGLLADGFAWTLNVSSAVAIVFVNKVLMQPNSGYGFTFACTLSAIHFLTAAACVIGAQALGMADKATHLPWKVTWGFSVVAVISIASLNLSLLLNPVGLYQVAKLLVIPFMCGVEAAWLGRRFNMATLCCIGTVIAGVAVVTVTDLGTGTATVLGVTLAAVSVVGSGMQQILCGHLQKLYRLQSHQLLAATAPVQGGLLLLMGPWVDAAVSGNWVGQYTLTAPAVAVLVASCVFSVGVNVSQFMCLGRFSAVTFQVLGHTKTILVLLISWVALGEPMSARKLLGMAIAVGGMIGYGYFVNASTTPPAKTSHAGGDSSSSTLSTAVELGGQGGRQQQQQQYGHSSDADVEEALLLRNVSKDHGWAGEHVVVVAVDRSNSGSSRR